VQINAVVGETLAKRRRLIVFLLCYGAKKRSNANQAERRDFLEAL
jgi:hypothetical protein